MQAMLDSLVKENFAHPVTYLHACKNRKQHSFKGHVESVKNTLNLQSHTWYENDVSSSQNETTGRMKIEDVKGSLPLKEGEFYLCGPLQFMLTIKQELLALGVSQSRINYELFGPHQEV
jgi:nitric oxide dioxygenase